MINLYFIKNISRLDTIRFANPYQRDSYFSNFIETNIDAIYPPHFQNRIQISIEDLSPSTKVNYLSLEYEGKDYYYFIDNINYINEGVYELDITMDTITTFMFDLSINEAILERFSIERWNNDGSINRNYIRENLSKGHFKNDYCNKITFNNLGRLGNEEYLPSILLHRRRPLNNESFPNIFIQTGDEYIELNNTIGQCVISQEKFDNSSNFVSDGSYYYLFPLIPSNIETIYFSSEVRGDFYVPLSFNSYMYFFLPLLEDGDTVDAYLIDNDILNQIFYYNIENKIIDIKTYNKYRECSIMRFTYNDSNNGGELNGMCIKLGNLNLINCKDEIKIKYDNNNFYKNTQLNADFSPKYIPQLIDGNYFKLLYGEKMEYTSYPLHHLTNNSLFIEKQYDLFSGARDYRIVEDNDIYDKYMTNIIVQTKETVNLYKDALTNYMQTNKGSLTMGVALAKQNAQWNFAKDIFNDFTSLKKGNNSKSVLTNIGNIGSTIGDTFMTFYNIDTQLQINKTNAEYTPDTSRQGNNYTSDLNSLALKCLLIQESVNDLIYVAKKYEQFGYLINEEIKNKTLYNDFNNRYYFNVIKLQNVDIELNYINTVSLMKNITDRLENGLRIWNIHDELNLSLPVIDYSKFEYDNVENEYI